MYRRLSVLCRFLIAGFLASCATHQRGSVARPLRVLLITGGCCHNYPFQASQLTTALARHLRAEWTIVNEGGNGTQAMIPFYDHSDWAKPYDVIIHNECFADTKDPAYLRRITAVHHAGKPAVVIHCAMNTYRATDVDDWREFLGVTSRRHDHQSRYPVKTVAPDHPIMKGVPADWVTPKDELYVIEKLWPNARTLATSVSELDGKAYPVAWVNQYGQARVFGTTYGHSDETFSDPVYLGMVRRGILWAAGIE